MNHQEALRLIRSEMKPSMGCTEPVAVGLAVSNTSARLKGPAEQIRLKMSSNIFKNAFCVKIPNTTRAGIPLAAALGYLLAAPDNTMELFSGVTDQLVEQADKLLAKDFVALEVQPDSRFYIEVEAVGHGERVRTITLDSHDNLVYVEKDGVALLNQSPSENPETAEEEGDTAKIIHSTIREIVALSESVELKKIDFLQEGIDMNQAVSRAGLQHRYGLDVGKNIRRMVGDGNLPDDLASHVKMTVAAACDCRMGGGAYSAMTVLGSGNQGFSCILSVAAAADYLKADRERTLRSVMISILITIHIKYQVGRLSPICGATLSGAAASGAIVWLLGGTVEQMEGAIQNMLGNLSGMVCDGAKDGCALKLSNCAGEAVLSARLAMGNSIIQKTDGIISERVEDTIRNVARLSKEGMAMVDRNIIAIMMSKNRAG